MKLECYLSDAQSLRLAHAILIYNAEGSLTMSTLHDIQTAEDKQPVIGPGRLLTREALERLVGELSGGVSRRSVLPEHVLCYEGNRLAWWVPSKYRPIFFNTPDTAFNKEVGETFVLHPPLVFMATLGNPLIIFALPANSRPGPKTPLFRAPYYNLYVNGNMCQGSVKLPDNVAPETIPAWEEAFFVTNFAHTNLHGEKLTHHKDGHNGLWRQMQTKDLSCFPSQMLVAVALTLEALINK